MHPLHSLKHRWEEHRHGYHYRLTYNPKNGRTWDVRCALCFLPCTDIPYQEHTGERDCAENNLFEIGFEAAQ